MTHELVMWIVALSLALGWAITMYVVLTEIWP
jgi:hypothetical protein